MWEGEGGGGVLYINDMATFEILSQVQVTNADNDRSFSLFLYLSIIIFTKNKENAFYG